MKFTSKPTPGHQEVPVADDGRLEEIVRYWTEREERAVNPSDDSKNKCYVVSINEGRDPHVCDAQLAEITNLVSAQGDDIAGSEIYHLKRVHPKTLLGTGTAREVAARAHACGANLLVVDAELTPSQVRNLEDAAGMPVCDREGIILNVFLRHAKTRQARIQIRAALICLFQRSPAMELLMLDEPTNSLDIVGRNALIGVLNRWPGGLIVVSHDQDFLGKINIHQTLDLEKRN